ncbi:MAG: hypothetical protein HFI95_09795 [Lachnospiraceae bacterium]|nr:hypothetical protein [Lachnospiraceae bacterium]
MEAPTETVTAPVADAAVPAVDMEVQTLTAVPAAAPADADAQAPEAPTVELEDEEVPLGVMDLEADDELAETDDQESFVELDDEEVPLADAAALAQSAGHGISHIIEIVATGVLSVFVAGSNRKQKKEISELKKELDDKGRR